MHWTTPLTKTTLVAALAAPLSLLLAGCPGDDGTADTDASSSSTGGADTTGGPGTGPDPDTTTSVTASSSSSTTAVADDTTTTTDDTTGDPPADGLCNGFDQVGNINTVLSRDGMPIDTTCDPTPAPCGGDVVGIWALEDTCGFEAFPNPLEDQCPGSTFTIEILSQTGTMTFVDDGTYVQDFDIESQAVIELNPMSCFGVNCATFESIVQMDSPSASCQSMGNTCTCTFPDDGASEQGMGTYEVVGTDLVFTDETGSAEAAFCIGGDRLDLWQPLFGLPVLTDIMCASDVDCYVELGDMYDAYICE